MHIFNYTVKLARAKFKKPHAQFTCVKCSLHVKKVNLPAYTRQNLTHNTYELPGAGCKHTRKKRTFYGYFYIWNSNNLARKWNATLPVFAFCKQ